MPTVRSSTARGTARRFNGNTLAAKIAGVRDNEKVKAVVLRVNSPAEARWHRTSSGARSNCCVPRNPVIVSMGSYAASGGYYISALPMRSWPTR